MRVRRDGFTMIELLLVLVLGVMIVAAAVDTLVNQERAYSRFRAVSLTQQDTRVGLDLLSAELREMSARGGDLLMATPDSIRFRSLRKFGMLCAVIDKNTKRIVVAQTGADRFRGGDSVLVYVDQDSLMERDDLWQRDMVSSVSNSASCTNTFGLSLPTLMPGYALLQVTIQGAGLRYDSIFPGAPVRSFQNLTYRAQNVGGDRMLVAVRADTVNPLLGPLDPVRGLRFRYFDRDGTELTSFPLSATDRARVRNVRVEMRAARDAGMPTGTYVDALTTDIFTRGS